MNESSITIRWEKNSDNCTDISVNGDIDYQTYFRESFLSLDSLPTLYDVGEDKTKSESAVKSATISLLTQLIDIIGNSNKTIGQIVSEKERDTKFPFTDLIVIRKFAQIVGIDFDERRFRNRREFRMYFQSLIKNT